MLSSKTYGYVHIRQDDHPITLFNNNVYDNIGKVGIILNHRRKFIEKCFNLEL